MANFSFKQTEDVKMWHDWLLWVLMAIGLVVGALISLI